VRFKACWFACLGLGRDVGKKLLQPGSADDVIEIMFIGIDGVVRIPKKAMRLFTDIIGQMAEGNAVKLLGEDKLLSSQEAAD